MMLRTEEVSKGVVSFTFRIYPDMLCGLAGIPAALITLYLL